jgi:hypothetical protein
MLAFGVLGGCGGGSARPGASVLMRDTFVSARPMQSGRMKLSAVLTAAAARPGGRDSGRLFSLLVQGPFQGLGSAALPRFALLVDVSAARSALAGYGRALSVGFTAIATGGRLLLELEGTRLQAPASALRALERGYSETLRARAGRTSRQPLGALGIDPGGWLVSPTQAGTATIAGEPTLHVRASLDAPHFLTDARTLLASASSLELGRDGDSGGLSPALRSALSSSLRAGRVDVYTGAHDHRLRRLSVSATLLVGGHARRALGGVGAARLTLVLEFSDLDRPQRISAPGPAAAHSASSSRSMPSSSSSSSSSSSRSSSGSGSPPAP